MSDRPENIPGIRRLPPQIRSVAKLPRGQRIAVVKGQDNGRFMDFYLNILTTSWPVFFLQLAAAFIVVNLIFAMLYAVDRAASPMRVQAASPTISSSACRPWAPWAMA